jgi:Family of unknown function (DUF6069)
MSGIRNTTAPARPEERTPLAAGRRRALRAATLVTAILAAELVWIVVVPVLGVDLVVTAPGAAGPVSAVAVAGAALLAGAAGWALLAMLEHFTSSAMPAWTVIAGVVLVVSLAGPLASGSLAATISLIVMHLVVGVVVTVGMSRSVGLR